MNEQPNNSSCEWLVFYGEPDSHVIPNHDLVPHTLSVDCWCFPSRDGQCVVHNSADDREIYERRSFSDRLKFN